MRGLALADITAEMLDELRAAKLSEGTKPRTANYVVSVACAILNAAVGWGWILKAPSLKPLKLPPGRVRWLTTKEADRLLAHLSGPLHAMAAFTLETGLRWSNVSGLRWSQVDLEFGTITIAAAEMKGRAGISMPLSQRAQQILREQAGKHRQWVFTSQGRQVQRPPRYAWNRALRGAGIDNFRWHDLRHTWASWHAQRGTPLLTLQQLGGWKSPSMVNRYAHLDTSALWAAVEGFDRWTATRRRPDQEGSASGAV